jgi:hypothetical protein
LKLSDHFEHYVKRIESREYFSFLKLNHFFWQEMLNGSQNFKNWNVCDLALKIIQILENFPKEDNLFLGVGFGGNDGVRPLNQHVNLVKKILPDYVDLHCALCFKRACMTRQIKKLYDCIRNRRVVVVGLEHLAPFGDLHSLNHFEHHLISLDYNKDQILENIQKEYKKDSVYMFQCGEVLSFWLIFYLREAFQDSFFLDMGRALDFGLDVFLSQNDKKIAQHKKYGEGFILSRPWMKKTNWKDKIKLL